MMIQIMCMTTTMDLLWKNMNKLFKLFYFLAVRMKKSFKKITGMSCARSMDRCRDSWGMVCMCRDSTIVT